MKKFADLLFRSGNPADVQLRASRELPLMLAKSNLHFWNLGDEIISTGTRFLVGIAVWSLYDLRLLDVLDAAFSNAPRTERVDVFDIDVCQTQEGILAFVPNIGKVIHTPVVGVWSDGLQIQQDSGYAGRKILVEAFELNHKEIAAL